jgi:hypothetical protein
MPTAEPRKLKSGADAHTFTLEDRQKAAATTNAKKRAAREEAERVRIEQLALMRLPAWVALAKLVESAESESVMLQAAQAVLDRDLGKPTQGVEVSGPDGEPIEVKDVRERLADRIAGRAARRGTPTDPV